MTYPSENYSDERAEQVADERARYEVPVMVVFESDEPFGRILDAEQIAETLLYEVQNRLLPVGNTLARMYVHHLYGAPCDPDDPNSPPVPARRLD